MIITRLFYALVLPLILMAGQVFAQEKTVTGRVTDSSGAPVSNASVVVKGARAGTQTSAEGAFSFKVPATATTLVISSVGFGSQDIAIGNGVINVSLQAVNTALSEVVVIGYGAVRKRDLTGSITTITAKDFQKGTITTPEQLIAGKVAGVSIISNGGAPGSGSTIRIRGGSSLNASNDPLIVIDGVPLDNNGIAGSANALSFINPNDIETFTVLKDASAAAIYGTRASNGVILITTKKGRSDKLRVNFSTVNSVANVFKQVEVLTADQVRAVVAEKGTPMQKAQVGAANTNWQKEIYQEAITTDNNISITGGIKKLPYRLSVGYLDQQGVLKTDRLKRVSGAFVLNPVFFKGHLKVDVNLKGSMQKYHFADQGVIGNAVYYDPTQPVFSNNKRFGGYFEWLKDGIPNPNAARNPLAMLNQRNANSNTKRSIGNIVLDYKFHFLPELRANLNLGYDVSEGKGSTIVQDSTSSALAYLTNGSFNEYLQTKKNTLFEFYLAYAKDLKSIKSRFDVLAGYSYNNYRTKDYNFATLNSTGGVITARSPFPFNIPENTLLSYFGRLNYVLNEKYLLTATVRRDGSSRFGPLNKYGTFPSLALSWRINDESFLKNSDVVSDLKIRLGYGITGQQDVPNNGSLYDFLSVYSLSNQSASYQFGNTFYQGYRPGGYNPTIKWEETTTSNIGLDYGFLKNRITGTIDLYYKKTKDLLSLVPQAAGNNFSAYQLENVGDMNNKGVEFNINTQPIKNSLVTLDVAFNLTYNKNEITNLTKIENDPNYPGFPTGGLAGVQGFAFLNNVGTSKNTYYLYHQVYDKSGKPIEGLLEDVNRDGIINENDKYMGKRADPNIFLGFSSNLSYGNWNAGFVMRGSFNNYVYNNIYSNNGRINQILGAQVTGNASVNYLETGFLGNTEQQPLSDYYLQNGSFLRMDNVNIGYNFGKVANNRATLRGTIGVQNVFVITKYTGIDPEVGGGIDNNLYPRPRIFSLGLNLDF